MPIQDISKRQQAISMYKIVVLLMPLFPSVHLKKIMDKLITHKAL